jgi:DNA modification methylase
MIAPELASLAVPVDSLTQLPGNPRRGDEESVRRSYVAFGQQKPIVVQHRGAEIVVIDGNTQHRVAAGLGWPAIAVSEFAIEDPPGSGQFRAGTIAEADAYALAVNRTADLGTYDDGALVTLLQSLDDDLRNVTSYSDDDLSVLLRSVGAAEKAGLTDPDDVPESAPPVTKPGDLWLLGEHRVLCGDSTVPTDVARLMDGAAPALLVTDPPYGVELDMEWRDRAGHDEMAPAERSYMKRAMAGQGISGDTRGDWSAAFALVPSLHVAYVWHATPHMLEVGAGLMSIGFELRQQIIWVKTVAAMSRSAYHWKHEPCWYAVRKGTTANWIGSRDQTTVWEAASPKHIMGGSKEEKLDHPTQKPVALMTQAIANHEGDVYDPFLGSGTTLMAAELVGRACYGVEIEPRYVDIVARRYQDFTGTKPVLESTGEPHDFTKE